MTDHLLKTSKALGDKTRLSIYRYLNQSLNDPPSIRLLANHFQLHVNAVRQHLARLEDAGLVYSESLKLKGSGRPQKIYKVKRPFLGSELLPRDYKFLSEILLEILAESKISSEEMKGFGHRWIKREFQNRGVTEETFHSTEELADMVISQFAGLGFEPMLTDLRQEQVGVRLNNCIFREAAETYPDLLCPLVHGLLEELLSFNSSQYPLTLDNGIAHGKETCEVLISIKTAPVSLPEPEICVSWLEKDSTVKEEGL